MGKMQEILGNVIGMTGVIVCSLAGDSRLLGAHYLQKSDTVTLLNRGCCTDGNGLPGEIASINDCCVLRQKP